jgi:hypothetical protein
MAEGLRKAVESIKEDLSLCPEMQEPLSDIVWVGAANQPVSPEIR